jgi:hypothetical protein
MVHDSDEDATDEDSSQDGGQEVIQCLNNKVYSDDVCPNPKSRQGRFSEVF